MPKYDSGIGAYHFLLLLFRRFARFLSSLYVHPAPRCKELPPAKCKIIVTTVLHAIYYLRSMPICTFEMNAMNCSSSSLKVILLSIIISCAARSSFAFTTPPSAAVRHSSSIQSSIITASSSLSSSAPDTAAVNEGEEESSQQNWDKVTEDWELDCYSRPVLVDGKKKLWEILVTDSSGNMRIRRALPSNKVNSREVRRVVEEIIDNSEVKPSTIRFFRGAMFNMVRLCTYLANQESQKQHLFN